MKKLAVGLVVALASVCAQGLFADVVLNCETQSEILHYNSVGGAARVSTVAFTGEIWVNVPSGTIPNENLIFSQFPQDTTSNKSFAFGLKNSKLGFYVASGGAWQVSDCVLARDEWIHLAVVRGNKSYTIYTNSVPVFTYSQANNFAPPAYTPLTIGGYFSSQYLAWHNTGKWSLSRMKLSEARFWSYERTVEQLTSERGHRLTGDEPGLVAYFPLTSDAVVGTTPEYVTGQDCPLGTKQTLVEDDTFHLEPAPMRVTPDDWPVFKPVARDSDAGLATSLVLPPAASLTLETWINISSTDQDQMPVMDMHADNVAGRCWFGLDRGRPGFWMDGLSPDTLRADAALPINKWVHLAFVLDKANLVEAIYTNGVLAASQPMSQAVDFPNLPVRLFGIDESRQCQDVLLRDVRVWSVAQSQEQIQANLFRQMNGNEQGLALYCPLTEGAERIRDKVSGNYLALPTGFGWTTAGRVWMASPSEWTIQKGMNGGLATAMPDNSVVFKNTTTFTFETWCCPHRPNTGTATEPFLLACFTNNLSSDVNGLTAITLYEENNPDFYLSGTRYRAQVGGKYVRIDYDTWSHVAVVRNGNTVSLYVNGEPAGTKTWTNLAPMKDNTVVIGAWNNRPWVDRGDSMAFNGGLREVRLWDIARTAAEIKENFRRKLKGNESGLVRYWPMNEKTATETTATELTTKTDLAVGLTNQYLPSFNELEREGLILIFR